MGMERNAKTREAGPQFKDRLKAARKQAGLTQDDLASQADISVVTVSKLEAGVNKPAFDVLMGLAYALDASPNYLTGWDAQPEPISESNRRILLNKLHAVAQRLPEDWIELLIVLAERAANPTERSP